MWEVVQSLAPIVLLIALGAALLRLGFYGDAFRQGLDRFVYWVALPCLFIAELSVADVQGGEAGAVSVVLVAATMVSLVIGLLLAMLLRMPRLATGVFVQACFRGNLVFVGLPVVLFSLGDTAPPDVRSLVVLAAAPIIVLYNVLSVSALLVAQQRITWKTLPRLLRSMITNPLIVGCLVGVIMSSIPGASPPRWLHRSLDLVGDTAPALALISMGSGLVVLKVGGELGRAVLASVVKVAVTPIVAAVLVQLAGLEGVQAEVAVTFAATPTAVASYVLAVQMGGDSRLAASSVLVSTAMSMVSLGVVLYVM